MNSWQLSRVGEEDNCLLKSSRLVALSMPRILHFKRLSVKYIIAATFNLE